MSSKTFDIIILNGRPAAGKSEVIDFLKNTPLEERIERFHIGNFEEFDDFCILWERFEDDDIYEKHGKERLISNTTFQYKGKEHRGYVFKDQFFWNYLIERLNLNYQKLMRDKPLYHQQATALIEFSRGAEHGGFQEAYSYLAADILDRAVTLYIDVSWDESLRKNRRRFNPNKPDSILEHALEDLKLEMLYKDSDWASFSAADPDHLLVRGHKVPYAVLKNEPEITCKEKYAALGAELERLFDKLWKLRPSR